jgi:hypothetical protein
MEDQYTILQVVNNRRKIQYEYQGKIQTMWLGEGEGLYRGDRVPLSHLLKEKEIQSKNIVHGNKVAFDNAVKQLEYHYNLVMDKRKAIDQAPSYTLRRAISSEQYHKKLLDEHDELYETQRRNRKEEFDRDMERLRRKYDEDIEKIDRKDEKQRLTKERDYSNAKENMEVEMKQKPEELVKKEEAYKRAYQEVLRHQRGLNINSEGKIEDKYVLDIVEGLELPNTTYITIPVSSYTPSPAELEADAESARLALMRQEAIQGEADRVREEKEKQREAREKALEQRRMEQEAEERRLTEARHHELETRDIPPPIIKKPVVKKPKREERFSESVHTYGIPCA